MLDLVGGRRSPGRRSSPGRTPPSRCPSPCRALSSHVGQDERHRPGRSSRQWGRESHGPWFQPEPRSSLVLGLQTQSPGSDHSERPHDWLQRCWSRPASRADSQCHPSSSKPPLGGSSPFPGSPVSSALAEGGGADSLLFSSFSSSGWYHERHSAHGSGVGPSMAAQRPAAGRLRYQYQTKRATQRSFATYLRKHSWACSPARHAGGPLLDPDRLTQNQKLPGFTSCSKGSSSLP
mgnify:CR=1 FL=1